MAKIFKVPYKQRAVIQRAYQRVIQRYGLVDEYTMKDSIRIGAGSRVALNKLYIQINAIYYFQFHDQFAHNTDIIRLWNGGSYPTYPITQEVFSDAKVQAALGEIYQQYYEWLAANFPLFDNAAIKNEPQILVGYEFFGDGGKWNKAIAFAPLD